MNFKKIPAAVAALAVALSMTACAQNKEPAQSISNISSVQSTSSVSTSSQNVSSTGSETSSETSSEIVSKPSEPEAEKIPLTAAELEELEKKLFFADLSLDRKLFDAYSDYDIKAVLKSPKSLDNGEFDDALYMVAESCESDKTKTVDTEFAVFDVDLYYPQTIEKYIKDNLIEDFDIGKFDYRKSLSWSEEDGMFSISSGEIGGGFIDTPGVIDGYQQNGEYHVYAFGANFCGSSRKEPITSFPENAAVKEIVLKDSCVISSKIASEIPEWFKTANDIHKMLLGDKMNDVYLDPYNTKWGVENSDMGKRMYISTGYEQGNTSHMSYSAKYTFGARGKDDIISCVKENAVEFDGVSVVANYSTHIEDGLMLQIYDYIETKYDGGSNNDTVSYTLNYMEISENEYRSAAAVKLFDENATVMISNYDNSEHSFKEMTIGEFYEIAKMVTE